MKFLFKPIILLFLIISTYDVNAQIVINEVMSKPGPNQSNNQGLRRKEYIEIYNNSCTDVDISCWIIGSSMYGLFDDYIGAFQFPSGTTIGPYSHLVIGGQEAQVGDPWPAVDIDYDISTFIGTQACDPNTSWLLPNYGGMLALYDPTGTVQDAIYYGSNANVITTDSDYTGHNPCDPGLGNSCGAAPVTLPNAREIYDNNPSDIAYVGDAGSYTDDLTFSRIPDGGAWQAGVAPSITGSNCNDGNCQVCPTCTPPTINPSANEENCGNGNGSVALNFTPGDASSYTYTWTSTVGGFVDPGTQDLSNLSAGDYTITVTDNDDANCSLPPQVVTVINNAVICCTAPTISPDTTSEVCGDASGTITLNLVPGDATSYTFDWTSTNGGFVNPGTENLNGLSAGDYTITVIDNDDPNCNLSPVVLTINNGGEPSIAPTVIPDTCQGGKGSISLNFTPGINTNYSYSWTSSNYGFVDPRTADINNLTAGTYNITVTDLDNGACSLSPQSVQVANETLPINVEFLNDSILVCNDGTAISENLTATYSPITAGVLWNTGETNDTILASVTGPFWMEASIDSCKYRDSVIITDVPGFIISETIVNESCIGKFDGKIILDLPGDETDYVYAWDNGETTRFIKDLMPGIYSVTVKDLIYRCPITKSFVVEDAVEFCPEIVPHIFVPSAFSPNHDGENDILYVRGEGIETIEFLIFDKWGRKVFESEDITVGWNGMFLNKNVLQGVYTYTVRATFVNRKEAVEYGQVTLIR